MSIPDGAEYWWDIRGHSYDNKGHKGHGKIKHKLVSMEEMIENGDKFVRLSEHDKTKIKKTMVKLGWVTSTKAAGQFMSEYKITYYKILVYFKNHGIVIIEGN